MKNNVYKIIPFFNPLDIKRQVTNLYDAGTLSYRHPEHIAFILTEVEHRLNERVYTKEPIQIVRFDKHSVYKQEMPSPLSKVIICLQCAKKGGNIVISGTIMSQKKVITLNVNSMILLSPLTEYTVSNVTKGQLIAITLDVDIPSIRIIYTSVERIHYGSTLLVLSPFAKQDVVFFVKQLLDEDYKVVCEQILINKEWYTIIKTEQKNLYIQSRCFGKALLHFNFVYDHFDTSTIEYIINTPIPFSMVSPQKKIYTSRVMYEKALYGKLTVV
ncbi:m126R [Myxoma virus]|uniref:M126R n=1 Tax=Myxoma virus TaxID=10273 RepID=A0A481N3U0_9POXV|nr:m126R [Myxoma virus]QAV37312.1 m126R [Myxoma virus]QAV37650.1 m126R [Myxoma virus]QAV39171.1 m126R [Myxoma virus]QAV39340.1 m126R [Myxoma virus]